MTITQKLSRRKFFKYGGIAIGGGVFSFAARENPLLDLIQEKKTIITQYRTLGRTKFKVSNIAMGGTKNIDSNVVRYAYDKGINYFDTAEGYFNGGNEKAIGGAMPSMDRKKIFITTKLAVQVTDTRESILDRFHKCLERLQTDYVDALYFHNPPVEILDHQGFHSAAGILHSEGKIRFIGLSSHGGGEKSKNTMERILLTAIEDGRFDLMLFVYNFMNREVAEKVLAAAKKKNIGTTAMKTAPGVLRADEYDPEHPTAEQQKLIDNFLRRGRSKEAAERFIKRRVHRRNQFYKKTRPFLEKYGVKTQEELRLKSIQWVLQNPDMHTVCVSFSDYEFIDKVVALSAQKLSSSDQMYLRDFQYAFNDQYCRHGCSECRGFCPHKLPVNSIMRYVYYFEDQGREKEARYKYARLRGRDASLCFSCEAPCLRACPYGLDIQTQLLQAHSLLTFA